MTVGQKNREGRRERGAKPPELLYILFESKKFCFEVFSFAMFKLVRPAD